MPDAWASPAKVIVLKDIVRAAHKEFWQGAALNEEGAQQGAPNIQQEG